MDQSSAFGGQDCEIGKINETVLYFLCLDIIEFHPPHRIASSKLKAEGTICDVWC